jgi:putative Mg2+ transporter-C (MgtC) family protein
MELFWQELTADLPELAHFLTLLFRLVMAALVGALPGLQREIRGVPAGLRTHMLVSLGSAIFVLAALESGAGAAETTRVIQGLAAGIGFVGAGAILKSALRSEVHGLTTAANIWLTAGLGTAVGMGRIWLGVMGSVLAYCVLALVGRAESQLASARGKSTHDQSNRAQN